MDELETKASLMGSYPHKVCKANMSTRDHLQLGGSFLVFLVIRSKFRQKLDSKWKMWMLLTVGT